MELTPEEILKVKTKGTLNIIEGSPLHKAVISAMKYYAKQEVEAGQHETIVKWRDMNKEMPDTEHIEKRTQFLLKGAYGTPGRLGATCYIVSRLDEAAYNCGDEIVFESPVGFIPEKWQHIK